MEAILNNIGAFLSHPFMMMIYGLLTHFLMKFKHYRRDDDSKPASRIIVSYYKDNPFSTITSIVGACAGFGLLYGTAELTRATAYGIGYMADSIADNLGSRSVSKLK